MIVKDNKNKEILKIAGLFKSKIFILLPKVIKLIKLFDFKIKIFTNISRKSINMKCN